jgi:hypothetical protein
MDLSESMADEQISVVDQIESANLDSNQVG